MSEEPWVVYVDQGGVRHVYGPMPQRLASDLYTVFKRADPYTKVDGYGYLTKKLYDEDQELRSRIKG